MPIRKRQPTETSPEGERLLHALQLLSKQFKLRETFLHDLAFEENDWVFVVKVHAFAEALVCTILANHLNRPELEEFFPEINMGRRIEMLKKLGLGEEAKTHALSAISRLRNKVVHNVQETDFTFEGFFVEMKEREWFANHFAMTWRDPGMKLDFKPNLGSSASSLISQRWR